MGDFLTEYYLWNKALHIASVMFWMAGMFYLPRLFVYHAETEVGSEFSEKLKIMERRLLRIIMTPAMLASFFFGTLLIFTPGVLTAPLGWFHLKLLLVFAMAGFHGLLSYMTKIFAQDKNQKKSKFFRILNEVPPLLALIIIITVVIKPF